MILRSFHYYFADNGEPYDRIDIFDVYKINSSSKNVEVQYYGNWTNQRSGYGEPGKSLLLSNEVMRKRRGDLKGYHIR